MTRRRPGKDDVDRLLRDTLADDLPRDVEGRLRTTMRSSWRTAVAGVSADEPAAQERAVRALESWSPQRALLAGAALVALAVGVVIHLEAGGGPLAESLLAQQAAARVVSQLQRVSAMSCRLETRDPQGRALRFAIDWRDTGETGVRVEAPDATRHRTVHLPREASAVLIQAQGRPAQAALRSDDPELGPADAHLTPERLAGLLAGKWELIPSPPEAHPGVATFSVSTPGRPDAVRVAVDTETYLPLSVEQGPPRSGSPGPGHPTWSRARFVWTLAPFSPRLLNGHARLETARERSAWS